MGLLLGWSAAFSGWVTGGGGAGEGEGGRGGSRRSYLVLCGLMGKGGGRRRGGRGAGGQQEELLGAVWADG